VTLELVGMTGGVRRRPLLLPPLPSVPSDGVAEEKGSAAGGDAPQGANEQPQSNVSVARHTSEQSRSDEFFDAGNRDQQQSREEHSSEDDADQGVNNADQRRDDATGRGDNVRHPSPAHSHRSDVQVNRDASNSLEGTEGQQNSLGAVGGENEFTLPPMVKTEAWGQSNQVHDGVRKDGHDSGEKTDPRGLATASEVDQWFSLCHWDAQDEILGGPTERVYFLRAICGIELGERSELRVEWCEPDRRLGYLLRLDTAERVLLELLKLNQANVEKGLVNKGIAHAIAVRREWTGILKDLLVETRPGQRAELWRGTSRVLDAWQREKIPGYESWEASLDNLASESESELCQRARRIKKLAMAQPKKGKRSDDVTSLRSASSRTPKTHPIK
jgi:hypothetical protein